MRWLTSGVVVAVLTGAGAIGASCVSPDETKAEVDPALADVVFEGAATPPALESFLDATPVPNVKLGPYLTDPPDNAILQVSKPPVFSWTVDGMTAQRDTPAPAAPPVLLPIAPTRSSAPFPAWLAELLGPERSASAAQLGMHGKGYFLLFATDNTPRLLRVFTTKTSYAPDEKAWKTLSSAGMWTKLTVVSANFWNDALQPGTGPYVGAPILFCVEPG